MNETIEIDNRLLDELGRVVGQMFAQGLDKASDVSKRAVLGGLDEKRLKISVDITLPPLQISFGVVNADGTNRVPLFTFKDSTQKPVTITPLAPGNDAVN